jgi:predicted ATPase/signal transduction histidine kinase
VTSEYEIRETVDTDGQLVVQRAVRRSDGKRVVVTHLARGGYPTTQEVRQFEFEHRILSKVRGAGVTDAVACHDGDANPMLVVEDFGGQPLLVGPRGLDVDLFFLVARSLAEILGHVHSRGVIHNDVRTQNVWVNPDTSEVRLGNFRRATELSREREGAGGGGITGESLPYTSPERTGRINREVDYRTDYYSLGVTLFEMATGQLPFRAADNIGWAHCHISKQPPLASEIRPGLPRMAAAIIDKLLRKEPDERYQSARGLLADLERCAHEWRSTGAIAPFDLGTADVPERFELSRRLVGREREVATLLDAFDEAARGASPLVLVGGPSGIGKTSVISEIHRPVVERRGYFIAGKFDQLERNVPYAALAQALRSLVHQILTEPEQALAGWRSRLTAALGANQSLLVELMPELEPVLGRPAPSGAVGSGELQRRLKFAFRQLLGAVAQPEHPLVLFLDDLQWADSSTLDLLIEVVSSSAVGHLLVVGAYRDDEVYAGHPFSLAVAQIESGRDGVVRRVHLSPLDEAAVTRLVAHAFRCSSDEVGSVGAVIRERTDGNPFFVNELLSSLHRGGLLSFDAAKGRWSCDPAELQRVAVSANIAELLVKRLRELPARSLALLQVASCMGHEFDLLTLARVSGHGPDETARVLWEPVKAGLLVPLDSAYRLVGGGDEDRTASEMNPRYRFQHDRVQQAAYSLLDDETRASIHLSAGRHLLEGATSEVLEERLFEIVNHLNLGSAGISDDGERAWLAELNLRAGAKAKRATAYAIALHYFTRGAELAGESAGGFAARRDRAECAFLAGDLELSETLCAELLSSARTRLDRAAAHSLRVMLLEHQSRMAEAVTASRQGLALLGVELPEDPAAIERGIGAGIARMQEHLARVRVEDLPKLPEMVDPEKLMVTDLLFQAIPAAIQTYPALFILAELIMFDLALTEGVSPASCKNLVDCGIVQGNVLGDYAVAYRLGRAAFELLNRYKPTPLESAVNFVFGAFISHWGGPVREGLQAFEEARRRGLELGDVQHVAYAIVHRLHRLLLIGANLASCEAENRAGVDYLSRAHASGQLVGTLVSSRAVARLTAAEGSAGERDRGDAEALAALRRAKNPQWWFSYAQAQTMTHFLLRDLAAAAHWQGISSQHQGSGPGLFSVPDFYLFRGLLLTRTWRTTAPPDAEARRQALAEIEEKLSRFAQAGPASFAHKHLLLRAERLRVDGAPLEAVLRAYEDAHRAAGEDFIHLRALSRELAAELCLDRAYPELARLLMGEAHRLYGQWGARGKLAELAARFPDWFVGPSEAAEGAPAERDGSSDLASVLKATQVLSGEVKSERLFRRLLDTLVENGGAQCGCLILKDERDGELYVEARSDVDGAASQELRRERLEDAAGLSPEIVRYVARTLEPVVLDDAAAGDEFPADLHIRERRVRSVLCMPLLRQRELVGILYMENNAARRVFTRSRLDVMQVIASQAAISITNARLYEGLEEKVAERTRELEASHRQFQALIETVDGVPWEMDPDTMQFTYVGPQAEILLGYPSSDWKAPGFLAEHLDQGDAAAIGAALRVALESGRAPELEFRLRGADGRTVWVRNVLTVRDHAGGRVLRGLILDQTKRKQLEMELQQAQKLESVGRLAAGIAHEINTPIQFVNDSVHFVRDAMVDLGRVVGRYRETREKLAKDPGWEQEARALREADEAADLDYLVENIPSALERSIDGLSRVAAIVRSMKEFAHPDQGQQAPADINRAIENTIIMACNEYKYVAEIELEMGELPKVNCKVGELNQVVLNMVVNAAHAIGDVVKDTGSKGKISVRTWREGEDAVIAIRDTGAGIPAGIRDRIFDPFFTTKEVGRGTGQGLAIARTVIVEGHGGTLTFETEVGKGSTFFIRLPIAGKHDERRSLAA